MRARCGRRASPADRRGASLLLFAVLASGACSPSGASAPDDAGAGDGGGDDATVADGSPTYQAVYDQILAPNCALPFCHGGAGDYLQLATADVGYTSLVGAPAQGPLCAPTNLERVDPGHPEDSLLFLKITNPPCGVRMPLLYTYSGMLSDPQINQIGQWIACGALPGDTPCPADASTFVWDGAVFEAGADEGGGAGSPPDGATQAPPPGDATIDGL